MAVFMIERRYADQLEVTAEAADGINRINEDEGVRWLYSFLSADKRKTYCLYEAASADAIRRAARANGRGQQLRARPEGGAVNETTGILVLAEAAITNWRKLWLFKRVAGPLRRVACGVRMTRSRSRRCPSTRLRARRT